jgi:hypothetical protein
MGISLDGMSAVLLTLAACSVIHHLIGISFDGISFEQYHLSLIWLTHNNLWMLRRAQTIKPSWSYLNTVRELDMSKVTELI